jgi:hypothetical protein
MLFSGSLLQISDECRDLLHRILIAGGWVYQGRTTGMKGPAARPVHYQQPSRRRQHGRGCNRPGQQQVSGHGKHGSSGSSASRYSPSGVVLPMKLWQLCPLAAGKTEVSQSKLDSKGSLRMNAQQPLKHWRLLQPNGLC